jgi:hypothetical protein
MTHRFNMFRTAKFALLAGLIALAPGLASAQAPVCSILKGTYAHTFSGTFPFPGPPAILAPFNGVGVTTFDGAGNVTITETAIFPGAVFSHTGSPGIYTLNPDCTGTLTGKDPTIVQPLELAFVVADGGKTIYAVGVDASLPPGSSLTFIYTKIPVRWQ